MNIATSVPGATILVDGASYAAPHLFNWMGGESHTIGVMSPQAVSNNSRYTFGGWSDGMAATDSITVPPFAMTYTATFIAQYLLSGSASPQSAGTVVASPASPDGYYYSGVSVQVTAAANPGFVFANWSGDLSGSANPKPVTMSGPRTVTANFTAAPARPALTQPDSGSGNTQNFTVQFSHPSGWQNL